MRPFTVALVMAGGRSQRMRAGGCGLHKALRTVGDVPLIEWSLTALRGCPLAHVFVSLSAGETDIAQWMVAHGPRLSREVRVNLSLVVEEEPLGTIGAIALLPCMFDHVLVVNVDNVTNLDLGMLLAAHTASNAAVTIACHEQSFRIPFGRLEVSGEHVVRYCEKPEIAVPISSGTYVFARRAIDLVAVRARMDVPRLVELLIAGGDEVRVFRHSAVWLDVNDEVSLSAAEDLAREGRLAPISRRGPAHG